MSGHFRWSIFAATVIGLAIALWATGTVGFTDVMYSIARLGVGGFLWVMACSAGVLGLLGGAWFTAMPGEPFRRIPLFIWARTAREAASDLLPFSQLGGLVVGARTLIGGRLAPPRVYASMIVDLTTEMAGQLLFTLLGLWALGVMIEDVGDTQSLQPMAWAGAGAAVALVVAFTTLQRPALRFAGLLAKRLLPRANVPIDAILGELANFYRARASVSASFLLNLLAWLASAAIAWLTLHLMGEATPLWQVVALESLIFALRSVAFVIPGALGVQEAGYVILAPIFGIDPNAAIALSLIKRARDLSIGLSALLIWQLTELRTGLRASLGSVTE